MTQSNHTDEMRILRDWLKSKRETSALTMRDLGVRLGKPHSFVQKVEQGERRLDVVEYVWYCRALQSDPIEGLNRIQEKAKESGKIS